MVKLPGSIHLKNPNQDRDILTFGKPQEVADRDLHEGVARFGGFLRHPSYAHAYFKSAKILLENAKLKNELDEFGLPIFYLARHTIELKLKGLLEMAYDIFVMRYQLYPDMNPSEILPSKNQLERLVNSHNLDKLYRDLKQSCSKLNIEIPEKQFIDVISIINQYEVNPTWSRYSKSKDGLHVNEEIELPIVQILNYLEILFKTVSYDQESEDEKLESELNSIYTSLTSKMESS